MECALVSELPEGSDWTYEVKFDGYRAIGVKTSSNPILYSRNHKSFNKRFPQIAEALKDLPADTVIDCRGCSIGRIRQAGFFTAYSISRPIVLYLTRKLEGCPTRTPKEL